MRIPIRGGSIRFRVDGTYDERWHTVGDRQVPSPMILELREPDEPMIELTIEVINHVPRVVDLRIRRPEGGREVRKKDLALDLESLVEHAVAIGSGRHTDATESGGRVSRFPFGFPEDQREQELRRGIRAVQQARGRSQRQMTPDRMQKVAEIYLAQEVGGIEAVAEVYNVHRATAARWIAKIRATTELIPNQTEES
ncbi:hypothetical protein [Microbacterium aerolatum]|uniref:hypothetical protein n=1 Tax=Microbacterium aerolatum TaxID=153731 RepID=UPI0038503F18